MYCVVSPHIDDAVFSVGGFLFNYARERKTQVVNVFSVSQWTNPSISSDKRALTKAQVTKIRKDEEQAVSYELGYQSCCLDFEDLLLRDKALNRSIKRMVRAALLKMVSADDLLLFPLGLLHPDHMIISDIGFDLLSEGYRIIFYEDQPYVSTKDGLAQRSSLTITHNLAPVDVSIDLERKISLMRAYKSQASDEWIGMIVEYILNQGSTSPIERLWKPLNSDFTLSMLA